MDIFLNFVTFYGQHRKEECHNTPTPPLMVIGPVWTLTSSVWHVVNEPDTTEEESDFLKYLLNNSYRSITDQENGFKIQQRENKNTSSDVIKQEWCHQNQAAEKNKQGFSDVKIKVSRCELTWMKKTWEFIQEHNLMILH